MKNKSAYIAIDLKSFYASVECVDRGLDPFKTHLVVADASRTSKTICLAVSPALKKMGVSGRPRLFEVEQKTKELNRVRLANTNKQGFHGDSNDTEELKQNPFLKLNYIVAPPSMARYIEISTKIYQLYLKYISHADIHVYSIDEVFLDVSSYLNTYQASPRELAVKITQDILKSTGITATAGIGTNLYLAKVAMDIESKHIPPDSNGLYIAELNELSYRQKLWDHRPLTDFWRIGKAYAKKLESHGLMTMGDIAACSMGEFSKTKSKYNEDFLYQLFGVNAELLIDHAWGYEPCTINHIKAYKPLNNSVGHSQVLSEAYDYHKAKLVVLEMADLLVLDLVDKGLVSNQVVLGIGYDIENLSKAKNHYRGEIVLDSYGRAVPKPARASKNLKNHSSSTKVIMDAVRELFEKTADPHLLIRRLSLTANHTILESDLKNIQNKHKQYDLFLDSTEAKKKEVLQKKEDEKEKKMQKALLSIKKKFGKNAILKGINFEDGATTKSRNKQIGGHKA